MKKLFKYLGNIVTIFCVIVIIWGIISFIDVNLHNGYGGTGPSDWNMFKILIDWSNAR